MSPAVVTQAFLITIAALAHSAPISTDLDYSSTFQQFFKIKSLIDRINIKNFKGHHKSAVESAAPAEGALTQIDLTEEAIENDEVTPKIASDRIDFEVEPLDAVEEEETLEVTAPIVFEEVVPEVVSEAVEEETVGYAAAPVLEEEVVTEAVTALVEEEVVYAAAPDVEEEVVTEAVAAAVEEDVVAETAAPVLEEEVVPKAAAAVEEEVVTEAAVPSVEEDVTLNEIDIDPNPITPKFGYKILLKRVHGNIVPVGKIKFTLPAFMVELDPEFVTTVAPIVEEEDIEEDAAPVVEEEVVPKAAAEEVVTETAAPIVEDEVVTEAVAAVLDEEVLPYGAAPIVEEEVATEAPSVIEEFIPDVAAEAVEEEVVEDSIIEEINPRVAYTVEEASAVEQTTYVPPFADIQEPIISEIAEIDTIDQNTIAEGAMQVKADTELAVVEIRNLNQTSVLPMDSCGVTLEDSEALLVTLATSIADSAPAIEEILAVGRSLKDEKDSAALSLGGAKLLRLLEPFLESLVPAQISSCTDSSSSVVRTITGMAATLDTIAEGPGVTESRAEGLHKAATSLQLAAWMMSQLQASVHTMYSPACTEGYSSTADILAALGRVVEGYIPVVTVLGPENSVEELNETVEALNKAGEHIAAVEARSGTSLPGVECGASFSEMGLALERLAAFLVAAGEV